MDRYIVVCTDDINDLEEIVNKMIGNGYKPQGGIAAEYYEWVNDNGIETDATNYFQAMYKPDWEE